MLKYCFKRIFCFLIFLIDGDKITLNNLKTLNMCFDEFLEFLIVNSFTVLLNKSIYNPHCS